MQARKLLLDSVQFYTDLFAISLPAKLVLGIGAFAIFLQGFVALAPGLLDGVARDLSAMIGALAP